jgi:hypothetical protein
MTIQTQIDEYIATRLAYDEAHEISSAADKEHKAAKAKLVEVMEEEQQKGMKMDFGISFNLRNQFSISCNKDNEEDVKDWLHEQYGDLEEFVKPKVDKKVVEERLKDDIEGEKLDQFDVPDFMNLKTRPDVSCTGWKQFSLQHRGSK